LTGLAPHLPADQLAQALAVATAITDDDSRALALTGLAPHLSADQQPGVLAEALAATTAITRDSFRAQALTDLAPHLPAHQQPGVLAQALAAATAITDDTFRARALTGLAPHLPTALLPQASLIACMTSDESVVAVISRIRDIALTNRPGASTLVASVRVFTSTPHRSRLLLAVAELASVFPAITTDDGMRKVPNMIQTVYRWFLP
jgi:hypothetical protein